jgi:hypothetical protein
MLHPSCLRSFCFHFWFLWTVFVFLVIKNLFSTNALNPPLDVTPIMINIAFAKHAGHIALLGSLLLGFFAGLL